MSWKETGKMDERMRLIGEHLSGDFTVSELARRRGVSRKTVYKWIGRYEADPERGLADRSRAPQRHPNAITEGLEGEILAWKARRPTWGAPKIHSKLAERADCPAESTVGNVLRRHGLTKPVRRRAHPGGGPARPLGGLCGPNEVWSVDFKGWFRTGDGRRCDPLTVSDAYSRYLLCCRGLAGRTGRESVQPLFETVFREYGLPWAIRSDNGAPFASAGLGGLSRLSVWWLRLGIGLDRIAPGHPEQNGRHERMHRTLKAETLSPPQATLRHQQRVFDGFRRDYNEERPHEALNQRPPASVYAPSPRDYPARLPEPEYAEDWQKRSVRQNGELKWRGHTVYVSQALAGQWVGLVVVAEDTWDVYFMGHRLGCLDQRKARIQPAGKV